MAVDPVCRIHVDENEAELTGQFTAQYGGGMFYFCSQECQDKFEQTPEQYAKKTAGFVSSVIV